MLNVFLLPRRSHSPVALTTSLDVVAVDTRRRSVVVEALGSLFFFVVINVLQVESMHVPGKVAEKR